MSLPLPPRMPISSFAFLKKLRHNAFHAARYYHQLYGDLLYGTVLSTDMLSLAHPDYVKWILYDHREKYQKPKKLEVSVGRFLGKDGLFNTNNYSVWQQDRGIIAPYFEPDQLIKHTGKVVANTVEYMDQLKAYAKSMDPLQIDTFMTKLSLINLFSTLIESSRKTVMIIDSFASSLLYAIARDLSTPDILAKFFYIKQRKNTQNIARHYDEICQEILEPRLSQSDPGDDFLGHLIKRLPGDLTQPEKIVHILDQLRTFVVAGHHTISTTLSWLWIHLAQHPTILRQLREEVMGALGNVPPTYDDLKKLPLLHASIKEVLRFQPPVVMFGRESIEEDEMAGYRIRKGTYVNLAVECLHKHPDFWQDPLAFKPERFLRESGYPKHDYAYIPFGAGPRNCVGQHFAVLEVTLVSIVLLQHFYFELIDDYQLNVSPYSIIHRPPPTTVVVRSF